MTVPSTARRAGPFYGTDTLVSYPFSFKTFDKSHVRVIIRDSIGVESDLVVDSSALITLNPDQDASPGGSVTYAVAGVGTALPSGYTLAILSNLAYSQETDLPEGGNYRATSVEDGLDALAVQVQQLAELSGRTFTLSALSGAVSAELPAPEAGKVLGWNLGENALINIDAGGGGGGAGLPTIAGQAGKVLGNNGTDLLWVAQSVGGGGGASNGIDITAAPYSADNTGVADIATALAAAFAACPVGGMIVLPAGGTYKLSTVNLDGKAVTIHAVGATINYTSATGALVKTDHGNTLTVIGGRWLGAAGARALRYNATASGVMYSDLVVSSAYFRSKDNFAVDLRGCREATFSQCVFETEASTSVPFSGGVYLSQANNPYFSHCFFIGRGKGYGFFADGAGSPNSANPVLDCCELLGWDVGVKIVGCDDGAMISCTVDYNITENTYISSQDVFKIDSCYLGGGIDGVSNRPALVITSEGALGYGPDACRFISISNTHFVGHQTTGNLLDLLQITGPSAAYYSTNIVVQGCHFQQYTRRGVSFALNGGALLLAGNTFVPIGGAAEPTTSVVFNAPGNGDTQVLMTGNHWPAGTTLSGANLARARTDNNLGHGTAGYISRSGSVSPELTLVADRGTVLAQTDGLWVKGGTDGTNVGWAKMGSAAGATRSYVYAHTSTQAFNSNPSALTKVFFQVEAEDARGEWDGANFVAIEAGDYLVNCVMVGTASGNFVLNEQFRVDIFRDDFRLHAGVAANAQTSTPVNPQTSVNAVVPLTAGGKIDVRVFNNCSGGAVTASGTQFSTWITIKRLS